MIATSRLRKAEQDLLQARACRQQLLEVHLRLRLSGLLPGSPWLEERRAERVALVVFAAEEGMCGAFNINVGKNGGRSWTTSTLGESLTWKCFPSARKSSPNFPGPRAHTPRNCPSLGMPRTCTPPPAVWRTPSWRISVPDAMTAWRFSTPLTRAWAPRPSACAACCPSCPTPRHRDFPAPGTTPLRNRFPSRIRKRLRDVRRTDILEPGAEEVAATLYPMSIRAALFEMCLSEAKASRSVPHPCHAGGERQRPGTHRHSPIGVQQTPPTEHHRRIVRYFFPAPVTFSLPARKTP